MTGRTLTMYEAAGGEETFTRLVDRFYAGVAAAYYKGNRDAALIQGGFEAGYGFRLLDDGRYAEGLVALREAVAADQAQWQERPGPAQQCGQPVDVRRRTNSCTTYATAILRDRYCGYIGFTNDSLFSPRTGRCDP